MNLAPLSRNPQKMRLYFFLIVRPDVDVDSNNFSLIGAVLFLISWRSKSANTEALSINDPPLAMPVSMIQSGAGQNQFLDLDYVFRVLYDWKSHPIEIV